MNGCLFILFNVVFKCVNLIGMYSVYKEECFFVVWLIKYGSYLRYKWCRWFFYCYGKFNCFIFFIVLIVMKIVKCSL